MRFILCSCGITESVATVIWLSLSWRPLSVTGPCAAEGEIGTSSPHGDDHNLPLLQPAASSDAGFAMTSSFTSMVLTASWGLWSYRICCWTERFEVVSSLALEPRRTADVKKLLTSTLAVLSAWVQVLSLALLEAQLKILELTAGQVATMKASRFPSRSKIIDQRRPLFWWLVQRQTTLAKIDLDLVQWKLLVITLPVIIVLFEWSSWSWGRVSKVALGCGGVLNDIYRVFPYITFVPNSHRYWLHSRWSKPGYHLLQVP